MTDLAPVFVAVEIGRRGELGDDRLDHAVRTCAATAQPSVPMHLLIGGYDDDPREIWEIGEAAGYLARFASRLDEAALDCLDDHSWTLIGLCLGALAVVGKSADGKLTLAPVPGFGGPPH